MQRLTLILSDLYLPEEAVIGEFPQAQRMPALESLLRFAAAPLHVDDWRRWLLRQVDERLAETSLASICAYRQPGGDPLATAWLATPVALEARLDHVRMLDRGLLHLEAEERIAWCAEFDRVFAPEYSLHDCGERAFVLSGLRRAPVAVADPARFLGAEIGPALPGAQAPELRRLWAEIEMWLHGSALNAARERAGRRRISALWLWGRESDRLASMGIDGRGLAMYGGDPLIRGLNRMRQHPQTDVPEEPALIDGTAQHAIVELAAITGPGPERLAALDSSWFAAARQMLGNGGLSVLEIVANDRCFRITADARWRFWRRPRDWLQILAR